MIADDGYIYDKEDIIREMGVSEAEYYRLKRSNKIDLGKRFTDKRGISQIFFCEKDMEKALDVRRKNKNYSVKGLSIMFKMTQEEVHKLIKLEELRQCSEIGRVLKEGESKRYSTYEVNKIFADVIAEDGRPVLKESNKNVERLIEEAKIKSKRKKERKKRRIEKKGTIDIATDVEKNAGIYKFYNLKLGTEYKIYEATKEANKYSFVKNAKLINIYNNILLFDDGMFKECFLNNRYSFKLIEVE